MTEEKFVDDYMVTWKNMVDQNGHVIPFDRDNAVVMLKKHPALFESLKRFMELGDRL